MRLKAMQVLYGYWQGGKEASIDQLERQLEKSVEDFYRLYLYELLFLEEFLAYLSVYDDQIKDKGIPQAEGLGSHLKLQRLGIAQKLFDSEEYKDALSKYAVAWSMEDAEGVFKKILIDLKNTELFREFESSNDSEYLEADLAAFIVRNYVEESPLLHQHVEERFLNEQDDQKTVKGMVRKTMTNLATNKQPYLAPIYLDRENTVDYAKELIRCVVNSFDIHHEQIVNKITKWEPNQIAIVDSILLHMGVAEFQHFPSIPHTVTINEYVEMAKGYSPPESKSFINGVLESIRRDLSIKN